MGGAELPQLTVWSLRPTRLEEVSHGDLTAPRSCSANCKPNLGPFFFFSPQPPVLVYFVFLRGKKGFASTLKSRRPVQRSCTIFQEISHRAARHLLYPPHSTAESGAAESAGQWPGRVQTSYTRFPPRLFVCSEAALPLQGKKKERNLSGGQRDAGKSRDGVFFQIK